MPDRTPIEGDTVTLEPLDPSRHASRLYAAVAGSDELWGFLPYGPFEDEAAFSAWITGCAASTDPLFYAILDRASGEPRGLGVRSSGRLLGLLVMSRGDGDLVPGARG